jgi:glycosyltransferase involved in cell wall biosynthesis
VVATHVGGIPEIMNDECGRLVPPRDSVELAQALSFVLDTTWDASAISASRGRSWTAVAAELMDVFHSVLSDSQAAAHDQ